MNHSALAPLAPLAAALLMAGCAVTSPPLPAEPAMPAAFAGSSEWQRLPATGAAVPEAWWTLFHDPVLDGLQADLVVGNQNLAAALAQLASARAVLRASGSAIWPTLSLGGATTRSASESNGRRTVSTSDALTANAAWEIDLWGRLAEAVKVAGASYRASQADLAALRLSAQATLTQTYFALRTAEAQQALLERTVAADRRALELTQDRYAGGVVAQTDVLQARTQLRNVESQLSEMRSQRAQLEHALAAQLGKLPGQFRVPAAADAHLPELPPVPALVPSTLLAQRPDLAAARERQRAAYAQIGVADAAFFPAVDLSASGGYRGSSWSHLVSAPNLIWSLGAAVTAPLFDGGQRRLASDQARASAEVATANYRQAVLTAFQEVEDNLVQFAETGAEVALQRDALEAAQRNLDIVMAQYRAGTVSYLNVSAAQSSLLSAEGNVLTARNRQLAAANLLLKNLGGRLPPAA
ncbi:efflux transporter outer membrane subunit [Pelomonas sp. P7]|uniref:Efflux transporter outer membrane subunit n=2 Tax=Roseateles TaxID=93681 RepID=A0ABS8XAF9_9BURK|nr:efflux transporter outer membrane subunit [Pelomonas sp. P7]MCE4537894.1 efflux transporter outer membrane subunit [Pelomonas sp. P7]